MSSRQDFENYVELQNVENVSLDTYLEIDSNLLTTHYSTDEDILRSVSNIADEETSEESEIVQQPSHKQVLQAFETLQNYFMSQEQTSDKTYMFINKIQKSYEHIRAANIRQQLITDFFKKTI